MVVEGKTGALNNKGASQENWGGSCAICRGGRGERRKKKRGERKRKREEKEIKQGRVSVFIWEKQ
jgi:hypothetical protein